MKKLKVHVLVLMAMLLALGIYGCGKNPTMPEPVSTLSATITHGKPMPASVDSIRRTCDNRGGTSMSDFIFARDSHQNFVVTWAELMVLNPDGTLRSAGHARFDHAVRDPLHNLVVGNYSSTPTHQYIYYDPLDGVTFERKLLPTPELAQELNDVYYFSSPGFTADGQLVVLQYVDHAYTVWYQDGTRITVSGLTKDGGAQGIRSMSVSPSGRYVALIPIEYQGGFWVVDRTTGKTFQCQRGAYIQEVAFITGDVLGCVSGDYVNGKLIGTLSIVRHNGTSQSSSTVIANGDSYRELSAMGGRKLLYSMYSYARAQQPICSYDIETATVQELTDGTRLDHAPLAGTR